VRRKGVLGWFGGPPTGAMREAEIPPGKAGVYPGRSHPPARPAPAGTGQHRPAPAGTSKSAESSQKPPMLPSHHRKFNPEEAPYAASKTQPPFSFLPSPMPGAL
jgi:hypothetical protein